MACHSPDSTAMPRMRDSGPRMWHFGVPEFSSLPKVKNASAPLRMTNVSECLLCLWTGEKEPSSQVFICAAEL
eukprot:7168263-Pyramimonas_sp.AAC.3